MSKNLTRRRGFSMLELSLSLSSAAILTVSLGASLVVASRGLELGASPDGQRIDTARVAREVAQDLQQATRFTEQTATAATIQVPDRDGDGDPETIRYAWSGSAGAPLTYSLNGGSSVNLAPAAQSFNLTYNTRSMTAPAPPTEIMTSGVKLLYITGGTQVQTSGVGASQRVATPVMLLSNPSSLDRIKIDLFESWGYDVTFVLPNEPWSSLSSLVDQSQLVFVSAEADTNQLNSSIYNSTKGIVIERTYQYDDAHFASNANSISTNAIRVRSPSHYILSGYTNAQLVPILATSDEFYYFNSVGDEVRNLMGPSGRSEPSMMALAPGDRMANGSDANGRRVLIPWGFPGLNYNNLTADGQAITRRALEWAAGAGSDPNDPYQTFGNTSVYVNLFTPGAGKMVATKVTLLEDAKIRSISAFVGGPIGTIRYAIYNHHSNNCPNSLIAESGLGVTTGGGHRWVTLSMPDKDLNAGEHWLAVCFGLNSQTVNMTPGGNYVTRNHDATLAGFRSSWGTPDSEEQMSFSIYATYEPK
jgi:hypothetical protein